LAGLAGLLVATLAIMIPSCSLAFLAGRAVSRWSERRWIGLLKEGLVPVALGLILASGISMMRTADHDALATAISLATAAFVVISRRNPLWAIAAGTCVYVAALRLGLLHSL
jgi:chromate transporter